MKIVDLGVCIDNNDPKGLGRIRVVDYDDYIGGKSNIKENIQHWSKDDPFIASPFLPNNINFIPEIKQAVKIIRYDTEKTTVNQEYIAGPFSTRYDFNSQEFNTQISQTSYGVSVEDKVDIIKNEQGTLPENCKDALSKYKDYSVGGKYGSDAIFTQDGLVLRGGKLVQKDVTSNQNRELLTKGFPIASNKVAKLHLKKFGPKQFIVDETKIEEITENSNLKFIIEYDVNDLSNPNYVNFYVYQIKPNVSKKYNSSNFTESTQTISGETVFLTESGNTYTFRSELNSITDYSGATLTKNAINNIGAALEFPVTLVLAQRNEVRNYAIDILKTVNGKRAEIDEMISSALVNWQIDRLAQVDKDILRIATAEMMFMSVASKVAIDEAVELAKRYSSEDGYRFINGVLRRIDDQLKELRKLK